MLMVRVADAQRGACMADAISTAFRLFGWNRRVLVLLDAGVPLSSADTFSSFPGDRDISQADVTLFDRLQPAKCTYFDPVKNEPCPCEEFVAHKDLFKGREGDHGAKRAKLRVCTSPICKSKHAHKPLETYEGLLSFLPIAPTFCLTRLDLVIPTLLVLVEKARIGDTFPHSKGADRTGLFCIDMRVRHVKRDKKTGDVGKLAPVVQEIGRICRYSKPENLPYTLVSQHLYDVRVSFARSLPHRSSRRSLRTRRASRPSVTRVSKSTRRATRPASSRSFFPSQSD